MKKMFCLLLSLSLLLGMCACGSSARYAETEMYTEGGAVAAGEYAEAEPAQYAMTEDAVAADDGWMASGSYDTENTGNTENAENADDTDYLTGLKIIKTGNLSLQTESYEDTDSMLREKVTAYQGMLTESMVSGTAGSRYASYTVRIPSDSFDAFFYDVAGESVVTYQSISSEDVTEQYTDLETRLETAKAKHARLLELLEQAETLTDIYTLESEISDVEYEIDSLSGTLNGLDSRISYSTIYIDVEETTRTVAMPEEQSFGAKLAAALKNGANNGAEGLQNLILAIARGWVGWLIFLVIAAVVVSVIIRHVKGKKRTARKKTMPKAEETPENPEGHQDETPRE